MAQPPESPAHARTASAEVFTWGTTAGEDKKPLSYMPAPRRNPSAKRTVMALIGLIVMAAVVGGLIYLRRTPVAVAASAAAPNTPTPVATEGTASIVSRPDGAQVMIDGVVRGVTPLKLTLPVGEHTLELQNGADKRTLPLTIEAGAVVRENVDLGPGAVTVGQLEVTSDPAGAHVTVDGAARGVTPLMLKDVEPGQHKIAITAGDVVVNRTVTVAAGATATVVASVSPVGAAGGFVSIASPIEVQIVEDGRVLGTSGMDRVMLPAGRHELELVAPAFDFRTTVTVQIPAGKAVSVPLTLPKGTLSVNALPWADVWIDGQSLGATPLGNLSLTIGNHEVMWRHPQFGERRQTVKVTAQTSVRAGVDFNK